jgi:hypothetical protein
MPFFLYLGGIVRDCSEQEETPEDFRESRTVSTAICSLTVVVVVLENIAVGLAGLSLSTKFND